MPAPVSALELKPDDLIREVSLNAINFYADELSGIYLPDDFKKAHVEKSMDVRWWKPSERLRGKFGRFTLAAAEGSEEQVQFDDVLLIGTTIGVEGLDRDGHMRSLRHFDLKHKAREIVEQRGLLGIVSIEPVDFGHTSIWLDEGGRLTGLQVSDSSGDFGRAQSQGRQETCDLFGRLLGDAIDIINEDPEPRSGDDIID